ncbi:Scr1 family TA system antitoxin-like transcriptional regulator [Saccharothrix hoggarensis]|uniref:Scr1 family TA system antitoxin-like transcriptional regulator n=1 Tax=Saccharothrix hoggarensis TaxID=913853 RepID=A0ABW3R690_9PSEU
MTAGEDIRPPLRLVPGLGWSSGPSTVDRTRRGPDLIDLIRLVGRRPGDPGEAAAECDVVVFETLCVPEPLRTPAYALALGDDGGDAFPRGARFFLHEAALHARVGDESVMADQLDALADRRDVPVRLVPFTAGHTGVLRSSFALPTGRRQADVLERIALDVASSRAEFRRWAAHYRSR